MKKILVIEDNIDLRESVEELLLLNDFEVFTAEDGKTGLKAIYKISPDLILCDIMMPYVDGYQVLKTNKNKPNFAKIPFIFMTARVDEKINGGTSGAITETYLTKPFNDKQLLSAINRSLFSNWKPLTNKGTKLL